ncbi:unnamed protein product [Mycena citricolor]|uniref:Vacuolar protein sorting-associated protein 8 central domain-containing protein n=1 Tax=Mycena citricolor TaxID=2018698 RepID=A0AAD2Q1I3_9AGAR|nr:unnamed protein product [Mycena citricolor]
MSSLHLQDFDLDENGDDTHTLHANEDKVDSGDYLSRMEDVMGDHADAQVSEQEDEDEDDDEGFVYNGEDAPETSFVYKDRLREVLGSEGEPDEEDHEVHEVEHSLIIPPDASHSDDDDVPLEQDDEVIPSLSVSSAGILTPPRADSPSLNGTPSKLLSRPFLHPNVSRLRSYTPGSRPMSSASFGSVNSHFFDASPSPSHFSSISRASSPSNMYTPSSSDAPVKNKQARTEREVFRWTPLRSITQHAFGPKKATSVLGNSSHGAPTVLAANGLICIGTDTGSICVYDFKQTLKCVCGEDTAGKAVGPVTALALSHDHTFVASGHASGYIQLFDLKNPSSPARTVPPITLTAVASGRQEGHIQGSRILSIGFVAGRHTALVTADEHGLAFYHSLGKLLFVEASDILRILGKYMEDNAPVSAGTKRSRYTILSMMPLPLGASPHTTDGYHVIALLTPTKLVVVGLKPTPKTWFKYRRPGNVMDSGNKWRGSMAWFPNAGENTAPILAFSWANTLFLLRITENRAKQLAKNSRTGKTAEMDVGRIVYSEAGQWSATEAILAVQWLNANQVIVLTASTLHVYDARLAKAVESVPFDGLSLVSPTLRATINGSVPYLDSVGDVAQSIRVYKGKIFLLGRDYVQAGTLLTWADRILGFVQDGDFLSAIDLARSYYLGEAPGNLNGLPDDAAAREVTIGEKIRELMVASSRYAFSEDRMSDGTHDTLDGRGVDRTALFEGLVDCCARACVALKDCEFVFEDLFQYYEDAGITRIYLLQLESFILSGDIRNVPPRITQRLVALHDQDGRPDLVERVIWHIDPLCLDINQAITLCERHHLYDALIYVYTRALNDYVAPVVTLLGLIRKVQQHRRTSAEPVPEGHPMEPVILNAYKIYPYLANCLSGLSYPSEEPLPPEEAALAKRDVYAFLFSGRSSIWPEGDGGKLVLTSDEEGVPEPTYPYARLLLRFDAESFLHSLDIAFEDSYLNDESLPISRLVIVRILLEIISSGRFPPCDVTFTDIFVARNVPKYQQALKTLKPSLLHGILVRLAEDPDPDTREDRQLAAEYLLSCFNPHESERIIHLFEAAGFYRILRTWYRREHQWVPLLCTYFDDPDLRSSELFSNADDILRTALRGNKGTLPSDMATTVASALPHLLDSSITGTAALVNKYTGHLHEVALASLGGHERFMYLEHLFASPAEAPLSLCEAFVALQCLYHPRDVVATLSSLPADDLDWPKLIQTCETNEAFDAVIWAVNRQGDAREALAKAATYEQQLTARLVESLNNADDPEVSLEKELGDLEAMGKTGITICLERSQGASATEVPLEDIWFQLLNSQISCVQNLTGCSTDLIPGREGKLDHTLSKLRLLVQETFEALVSISSTRAVSFPHLFKRLVTSATPSTTGTQYTEFKTILTGMLESYRSDGDMLSISKNLVDRDLFVIVEQATQERVRGWAPRHRNCTECHKPLLGNGQSQIIVSRTGKIYHTLCFPHTSLQSYGSHRSAHTVDSPQDAHVDNHVSGVCGPGPDLAAPASAPSASFSPPPNNNNPATSGSTYYFGFLVAFLAFLFLFLSLGLLARRRRMHLMREMMLYGSDDDTRVRLMAVPVISQPLYTRLGATSGRTSWRPLSASMVKRDVIDDKSPPATRTQRGRRVRHGTPSSSILVSRHGNNLAGTPVMPQPPDAADDPERPYFEMGVLHVPWTDPAIETQHQPTADELERDAP